MKVALFPKFSLQDKAEGGVRRVVEAERRLLPAHGFEFIEDLDAADLIAVHAGGAISRVQAGDTPRVFHCHGLYWSNYEWSPGIQNFNKGLIANAHRSDAVTTPAEWVADIFRKDMWLNPTVIYNGVDLPEKLEQPGGYVLWNKARVNSVCNPVWVDQLAVRRPGVKFISTFTQAPQKNVYTTGPLPFPDALDLVSKASVYLSTTQEVFSVGVLEAMSYGVPILGFDYGGNAEAVEHGKSGFLVPPGDVHALADGLDYVLSHRAELSEGARERAAHFDWPSAMQQYADLYTGLVANRLHGPKVSVIIPCFNLGRFVMDAVNSVLSQSLKDVEIIVVDDCSTDSVTLDVLESLKTLKRVKVLRTPKNLYLAHALNYGYSHAKGKYFMSLDADNMLPEHTLAKLSGVLDRYEDVDCSYGVLQLIREDGEIQTQVGPGGIPSPKWPPQTFDLVKQLRHENQAPSTCLFRRTLWERTGGYRQHAMFGDDADLWTRAAALGFRFQRSTSSPTLQYRQRDDSMTTTAGSDVHYDWTKWTPKHRAMLAVSGEPEIHETQVSIIVKDWSRNLIQTRDTVESIWAQSFDGWEVILDGADINAVKGFFPPYVKYGGTPKGKLIVELFGWEWLNQDALALLVEAYRRGGDEPRLVYSDYTLYDEGDRGDWHVTSPKRVKADPEGEVGVVLYERDRQPESAIYLPVPIVNRRLNERGGRIMACPTCGHRSARVHAPQQQSMSASSRMRGSAVPAEDDTVLIYFTGRGTRTVNVGGGVSYRFGEDAEHRTRRVRRQDLDKFARLSMYQIVEPADEVPIPGPADEVETPSEMSGESLGIVEDAEDFQKDAETGQEQVSSTSTRRVSNK